MNTVRDYPEGAFALEMLEGSPVRVEIHANRFVTAPRMWNDRRDGDHLTPAMIEHDDDGIVLKLAFGSPASNAYMLSHDLGHVLAATPAELQQRNLGLPINGIPASMSLKDQRRNEEKVLAWQALILRKAGRPNPDHTITQSIRILSSCIGLRPEKVWRNVERYAGRLESRWAAQCERIANLKPALALV